MSAHWFLTIDGISGESTDEHHPDAIDVDDWSWGVERPATIATGGGGGAGKPSFQSLDVSTTISQASPHLIAACATGELITQATLSGRRPATVSGESTAFFVIRLSDVTISSVQHSCSDGSPPVETVSLSYAKIEWRYTAQSMTGSTGTPVEASWDVTESKPVKMKNPNKLAKPVKK